MSQPARSKRRSILDAARRMFLDQGYSGTSMEAIAEAVPVSKPTLYTHFGSKPELFAAAIADQCEELLASFELTDPGRLEPEAGLRAIAKMFVDLIYSEASLGFYRVLIAENHHFPELGELAYRSSAGPVLKQLESWLVEVDRQGGLRVENAGWSSRLFLGMLQTDQHFRCMLGIQSGLSQHEKRELVDESVRLFLRGHGHVV